MPNIKSEHSTLFECAEMPKFEFGVVEKLTLDYRIGSKIKMSKFDWDIKNSEARGVEYEFEIIDISHHLVDRYTGIIDIIDTIYLKKLSEKPIK